MIDRFGNAVRTPYSMGDIENAVCRRFRLSRDILHGHRCLRKYVGPRQIAMYLGHEYLGLSFPQIGRYFNRHHTTVIHARNKVRELIKDGEFMPTYLKEVMDILGTIEPSRGRIAKALESGLHNHERISIMGHA